jgi:DNA-binding HxlR family transcriptional regulator
MQRESIALFCPLQGVIDIISKKWSLLVINEVGNHKNIRFNELRRELRGITAKSLTNTLNELQSNRLINRKDFDEKLPRTEYRLTEEGVRLYRLIIPLLKWAASRKGSVITECSCKAKSN